MTDLLPHIPYFHVDHVLSRAGGTGIVYWGIDLRSGYPVAIKQLYASRATTPAVVDAFRKEANNYVYLEHPRITKLVDFVEYEGSCYIVMEFIEGLTLDKFLEKKSGPMSDEMLIPIFMQMLETVDYIHNVSTPLCPHGMLHLDIKPANIMISENLEVKVMDLGISATLSDHSQLDFVAGTPSFMPPEQAHRGVLGTYTDVFALGVTLYFMLTGHLPYTGGSAQSIWAKIAAGRYQSPEVYYPYVNTAFCPIIKKALEPDYRKRYQSCVDMALDINKISR